MEDRQPIAYFNKALSARTLSKFVYEKEIMALALSIQHWQHYLLGRSFKVYTDHRSSKHLLQQRLTTTDQQCWLAKLMGFQYEVVYKPGTENKVVDALSRQLPSTEFNTISISPYWVDFPAIKNEVQNDLELVKLSSQLQSDSDSLPHYTLHDGFLFFKGCLMLPNLL